MEIALVTILAVVTFLLLLVIFSAFLFAIDLFLELPYVATQKETVKTIIKLAQIRRGETVIDLGSGDGRLLVAVAQKGVRAIGYEINPFLILLTKLKAKFSKSNIRHLISVRWHNFWKANLREADVIFVYGRQKTMKKFEDFVYKTTKPGTRIVVNTNPFPNKRHIKSRNGIFLYQT